jgi:hypothetical protein
VGRREELVMTTNGPTIAVLIIPVAVIAITLTVED